MLFITIDDMSYPILTTRAKFCLSVLHKQFPIWENKLVVLLKKIHIHVHMGEDFLEDFLGIKLLGILYLTIYVFASSGEKIHSTLAVLPAGITPLGFRQSKIL